MLSTITFEHGENTCASVPGTFCRFLSTMGWGTKPVCMLFEKEVSGPSTRPGSGDALRLLSKGLKC